MPLDVNSYAVLGLMAPVLATLIGMQWRYMSLMKNLSEVQLRGLETRLDELDSRCAGQSEQLGITIVTPADYKRTAAETERDKNTEFQIDGISGTVCGPVGAAYLAVRIERNAQLRLLCKLDVREGFWSATAKFPNWASYERFELIAFAVPAIAEFPVENNRINLPREAALSNPVTVIFPCRVAADRP